MVVRVACVRLFSSLITVNCSLLVKENQTNRKSKIASAQSQIASRNQSPIVINNSKS